jgi:uncharacterized protein (DUF2267 family)
MDQTNLGTETGTREEATERFFRHIQQSGAVPSGISAEQAATAVLCTLTMRVTGGQARDYVASIPQPLSALLIPCVQHRGEQPEKFDRAGFLQRVTDHLGVSMEDAERISRAVFAAVRSDLPQREADDVESQLPRDLAELWRAPAADVTERGEPQPVINIAGRDEATQRFFRDILGSGALPLGMAPEVAATAVLCILTLRVTGGQARDYVASLPRALNTMLLPCAAHRDEQPEKFDRAEFLRRVADHLSVGVEEAERITRAVFRGMQHDLPQREVDDVETQLPRDLAELWRNP